MSSVPAKPGDDIEFSAELAEEICDLIASGENAFTIMDGSAPEGRRKDLPSLRKFYRWCKDNPEFSRQVQAACVQRCAVLGEMMLDIPRKYRNDPNMGRVIADACKTLIQLYDPKKFAMQMNLKHDTTNLTTSELMEQNKALDAEIARLTGHARMN